MCTHPWPRTPSRPSARMHTQAPPTGDGLREGSSWLQALLQRGVVRGVFVPLATRRAAQAATLSIFLASECGC